MRINRISNHAKEQCKLREIDITTQVINAQLIVKTVDKKHDGKYQCFLSSGLLAVVDGNDNLVTVYYEREKRLRNIFRHEKPQNVSRETFINAINLLRMYEKEGRNHMIANH